MTGGLRILTAATVLSGAASLMHETLWMRFLAAALGSTVQAAAAVFAAFLVGLALGARFSGAILDRRRRIVPTYAAIEVGICVFAIASGLLLNQLRDQPLAALGPMTGLGGMVRAFGLTLALVLVPTVLMGATFPAVMAVCRRLGADGPGMVRLYGLNTLGAASGTIACGWFAIPALGVTRTMLLAGSLNLIAALLCLPLWSTERRPVAATEARPEAPVQEPYRGRQVWLYAIAVLSGAAVLSLEVIWSRIAAFTLGNRTFAFSTLLAWILLLLTCGAYLSGTLVRRFAGRIPHLLALLLLTAAAGIVLSITIVNAWILGPESLVSLLPNSPAVAIALRVVGMGLLMAPFLIPLGCLFPTGLCCLRGMEGRPGELAGAYYMWNTLGSVTGSLATGFIGLPALGSFGCAAFAALACALGSLPLSLPLARAQASRRFGLLGIAAAGAMVIATPLLMPEQLRAPQPNEKTVLRVEDEWGVFQLNELPDGRLRATNNRTDLVFLWGDFSTSYVQEMQAHIASFLRPSSRTALVIGSGYGITAGALTANPRIEHIDAVEILPAMVAAADRFIPYNRAYHRHPHVHVVVDDGRRFLASSHDRYDIVSINMSDPHLPGASAMFNVDFYKAIKGHLGESGIVLQHAFGSDADIVLSTLKHSFRYLRAFPTYHGGFNVAASDHPLRPLRDEVERLAALPSMREALAGIGILAPIDPWQIFSRGLPPSALSGRLQEDLVSTDDRPLLEFSRRGDPLTWFFSNE